MSIQKTNKSKYKSPSTDEYCTSQQYVVEVIMKREAKKNNQDLPLKFWNLDEYKKKYKTTLFRANSLIKAYSEDGLVQAVCKNTWLYSLFFPKIADLIEAEEKKLNEKVNITNIQDFEEDVNSFVQVNKNNRSIKSKLDE